MDGNAEVSTPGRQLVEFRGHHASIRRMDLWSLRDYSICPFVAPEF
jgi:hypothetical protein